MDFADKKIHQNDFVMASPKQQQVIASFTASSTKRHLVLEGPAGTGKTLVAKQVAPNLLESATDRQAMSLYWLPLLIGKREMTIS